MEEEALSTTKALVRGALIGLNAYIKPGGLHRLAPLKAVDSITCNLTSSIDGVVEAYIIGARMKRGELAATSVDYARILGNPLKESFRNCEGVYPEILIPLSVISHVIGHSGVESVLDESSKFKRSLEVVNSVSKWSDIKQLIDLFKAVGRSDMYDHLQSVGYTQLAILRSGAALNDVFRVLSSKWRGFSIIDSKEGIVFQYVKQLSDLYREYRSLENAVVAFYMELIKQHLPSNLQERAREAQKCKYMSTPECAKIMYELDLTLRRSKISFEWASEIAVLVSAIGSFEGLK